jgi:hypothetical protein
MSPKDGKAFPACWLSILKRCGRSHNVYGESIYLNKPNLMQPMERLDYLAGQINTQITAHA